MRGRKPKHGKSLRVLAETHGLSLSALEYRMRLGIPLDKALKIPSRNQEVSKETIESLTHLTFTEACRYLEVEPRKLRRLSKVFDIYFRRVSYTQHVESRVMIWGALHSPQLTYKSMMRFLTTELGFEVNENQIRYRFGMFGFTLKDAKKDRLKCQELMLKILWSPENEPIES